MTVADLSWLPAADDDEEPASLAAAGNTLVAPMSDWGLTPEGHSGAWESSNPHNQQLSLPLLTGMRTLQGGGHSRMRPTSPTSKAAPDSHSSRYVRIECSRHMWHVPLLPLTSQTDCQSSEQ